MYRRFKRLTYALPLGLMPKTLFLPAVETLSFLSTVETSFSHYRTLFFRFYKLFFPLQNPSV